jgi:hypothetical protein
MFFLEHCPFSAYPSVDDFLTIFPSFLSANKFGIKLISFIFFLNFIMKNIKLSAVLCALITLVFGCQPPEPNEIITIYEKGVFITHEGAFAGGTGSVTFYNGSIQNDIYSAANGGAAIGNVLQSMTIIGDKAYLVVNNAKRITVVDAKTFRYQDSITNTVLPRYLLDIDGKKAFVSEWGAGGIEGAVKVLDLTTKKFTKTINTGKGAERMLRNGTAVWVVNNGGFDSDSTVAIIDIASEVVIRRIVVGAAPNSLVQDSNGDIWVLCGGTYGVVNSGKLVQIKNNAIATTYNVPQGSNSLVINTTKNTFYFNTNNAIYQKDLTATGSSVFLDKPAAKAAFDALYGLGIDPKTGNLFCADAKDYASKGVVYIFNNAKILQDSLKTDVLPSNFLFQ